VSLTLPFTLPFMGRWLVQNSPARRIPSHGTDLLGLRYAIDFVGADEQGRSAPRRDWRTFLAAEPPERFFAFGRPILAPVDGVIVGTHDRELDHEARRSPLALVPYALGQASRLRRGVEAVAECVITVGTGGMPDPVTGEPPGGGPGGNGGSSSVACSDAPPLTAAGGRGGGGSGPTDSQSALGGSGGAASSNPGSGAEEFFSIAGGKGGESLPQFILTPPDDAGTSGGGGGGAGNGASGNGSNGSSSGFGGAGGPGGNGGGNGGDGSDENCNPQGSAGGSAPGGGGGGGAGFLPGVIAACPASPGADGFVKITVLGAPPGPPTVTKLPLDNAPSGPYDDGCNATDNTAAWLVTVAHNNDAPVTVLLQDSDVSQVGVPQNTLNLCNQLAGDWLEALTTDGVTCTFGAGSISFTVIRDVGARCADELTNEITAFEVTAEGNVPLGPFYGPEGNGVPIPSDPIACLPAVTKLPKQSSPFVDGYNASRDDISWEFTIKNSAGRCV
jgi:hypothetical protein